MEPHPVFYVIGVCFPRFLRKLSSANAKYSSEVIEMTDHTKRGSACTPNTAIHCSVTDCAHHCQDAEYCGLNSIRVGTHEADPAMDQCTDCQSFEKYC